MLTGCGGADEGETAEPSQGDGETEAVPEKTWAATPDGQEKRGHPSTDDHKGGSKQDQREDRTTRPKRGGRLNVSFDVAVEMLRQPPPGASNLRAGYDREKFSHWSDFDGDGCDTRDEVLLAETMLPRRTRAVGSSCSIEGGRWRSWYDGDSTTDSSSFDVDHMVPLAEAWESGARTWSPSRREAFANDQGDARSLVAVSASSNRSKSDRDPSSWLPDREACRYVRAWVAVKLRWDLAADARRSHRAALLADQVLRAHYGRPGGSRWESRERRRDVHRART